MCDITHHQTNNAETVGNNWSSMKAWKMVCVYTIYTTTSSSGLFIDFIIRNCVRENEIIIGVQSDLNLFCETGWQICLWKPQKWILHAVSWQLCFDLSRTRPVETCDLCLNTCVHEHIFRCYNAFHTTGTPEWSLQDRTSSISLTKDGDPLNYLHGFCRCRMWKCHNSHIIDVSR